MTQQVWILVCGALVFFMQAGFTCYEAGFVQSKNVISVSIENLLTFMITVVVFTFGGFYLMFGTSVFSIPSNAYGYLFLQVMFAAVAVTIFAGAMSERSKLSALLIASVVTVGLVYPVFGRWVWGMGSGSVLGASLGSGLGTGFGMTGAWLAQLGYMDFAGATVVHSTAGFITLAGLIIVGRRKSIKGGKSNIPLATLGVFILWFGWLGFNGGNADLTTDMIGLVFMNTTLAASAGMMGALAMNLLVRRKGQYLISIFNGVLAGLVAITAMSGYCGIWQSCAVGLIAGIAADLSSVLLERVGIDDVVNAVPTHLVGGLVGTLLLPFFIQSSYLVCDSRLLQFGIQALGVGVNFVWTFGASLLLFFLIDRTIGLRVSAEEEEKGLNIVEFKDIYSWENYLERSAYEAQIGEQNRLLRKQARLLAMTEEQERKKLARELHDGLGQSLAALKLILRMESTRTGASATMRR